jgi:hypothetical protein
MIIRLNEGPDTSHATLTLRNGGSSCISNSRARDARRLGLWYVFFVLNFFTLLMFFFRIDEGPNASMPPRRCETAVVAAVGARDCRVSGP